MTTNSRSEYTKDYFPLPGFIVLALGIWLWMVFYPGNMSVDSLYHYRQAITGQYTDLQPPLVAAVIALVLHLGGNLGTLILIQVLSGCFGFRYLAMNILVSFNLNKKLADYLSLLLLVVFLSPISPLAFYLVTLWKDTWYAILNLWVCALFLQLFSKPIASVSRTLAVCFGSAGLFAIAMLTRHNAIVVLPFWAMILWVILHEQRRHISFFFASILFCIAVREGVNYTQFRILHVERTYSEQAVLAMDLVGMLVVEPALQNQLTYISQHLAEDYREKYVFGQEYSLLEIVDFPVRGEKNQDLVDEYYRAIQSSPLIWASVKLTAFYELLRPDRSHYTYHAGMEKNKFGLKQNTDFKEIRNQYKQLAKLAIKHTPLRWVFGIGIVWITAGLLEFILACYLWFRYQNPKARFWAVLLTIPLSYCGSYLLATIDVDFRYIYPAMLLIEVFSISIAMALWIRFLQKRFSRI